MKLLLRSFALLALLGLAGCDGNSGGPSVGPSVGGGSGVAPAPSPDDPPKKSEDGYRQGAPITPPD